MGDAPGPPVSREDVDAFLAECDDVIADWEGSPDAASWSADGSHENHYGWVEVGWTEDGASVYWAPAGTNRAPNPEMRGARLHLIVIDEAQSWFDAEPEPEPTDPLVSAFLRWRQSVWDAERQEPVVEGPPDPPRGLEAQRSPYGPRRRRRVR